MFSILLTEFIPFTSFCQQEGGFEISGHLNGLKEGQKIFLTIMELGNFNYGTHDSVSVKNSTFQFKGTVPDGPRLYLLQFGKNNDNDMGRVCRLLINNNDKISISCDSDISKIDHSIIDAFLNIKNSPLNSCWQRTQSGIQMYCQNINLIRNNFKKIKDYAGFEPHMVELAIENKNMINSTLYTTFFKDFYRDVLYKPIVPFLLVAMKLYEWNDHASWLMDVYNSLDENVKNNYYGKILKLYGNISVGQKFPLCTLPSTDEKLLNLKDVIDKSKMTLVHFWTANSVDKATYEDELKVFYKKYHEKGLNIVGIYAGKYIDQWKDNLQQGQIPWYNVIDSKGSEGPCQKVYREPGDPTNPTPLEPNDTTNVLIDEQGRIVAWNVKGIELQYYLWKLFGE